MLLLQNNCLRMSAVVINSLAAQQVVLAGVFGQQTWNTSSPCWPWLSGAASSSQMSNACLEDKNRACAAASCKGIRLFLLPRKYCCCCTQPQTGCSPAKPEHDCTVHQVGSVQLQLRQLWYNQSIDCASSVLQLEKNTWIVAGRTELPRLAMQERHSREIR